jgi:parallel beta-helix repeat protein
MNSPLAASAFYSCKWGKAMQLASMLAIGRVVLAIVNAATALFATPVFADPSVFWFNDPVGPDDTVIVTGSELDKIIGVRVARIAKAMGDNGKSVDEPSKTVNIVQANPQSLKFVVPKEFNSGIYRFELSHERGVLTERANLPTVYWIQANLGEAASPAGWVRIFGRNIVRREHAQLTLTSSHGSAVVNLTSEKGDLWSGSFNLPSDIAVDTYRLRLSNGDGGAHEWVDIGELDLRVPEQLFGMQQIDVRSFGAIGDGNADDTAAVNAALSAAFARGGATVFFPRGRYLLTTMLSVPEGIRIKGERTDLVNLIWPDFPEPPNSLVSGRSRFAIEDLTIYASNHGHVVSGGFADDAPLPDASDIAIRRVRIRASAYRGEMPPEATYQRMATLRNRYHNTPDSIRLTGRHLTVTDCDVVGSGRSIFLYKANYAVIDGNILSNGRYGWYSVSGSRNVIFENNTVSAADLQGTGGGFNTLYRDAAISENILVRKNSFLGVLGTDREAMTTDGPGGFYFGAVAQVDDRCLMLRDGLSDQVADTKWIGAAVFVVDGQGAGQWARLADIKGTVMPGQQVSIVLDRTLKVRLNDSSRISIVRMQQNYLIVDNRFEDTGVAAQIYGTALNHVFAGNISARTGGFLSMGMYYHHFQPNWQVQLLNNRITEGNIYRSGPNHHVFSGEAVVSVEGQQPDQNPDNPPLTRAIVVRGNRLDNDAHIEVKGFSAASPGVRDVVIEHNTIGFSRVGIRIDKGVAHVVERSNEMKTAP